MREIRTMDKTYTKLVAARDAALRTIAGLLDSESAPETASAVGGFVHAVSTARDTMTLMTLAASIPPQIPATMAMMALSSQIAVVGYVAPKVEPKVQRLTVKANKAKGLFMALSGAFNVNLNGGVQSLMELELALPAIRKALQDHIDGHDVVAESHSVDKGNGVTQLKSLATCNGLIIGTPETADTVVEWIMKD